MDTLKSYLDVLAGVANIFTIGASGLAIYVYLKNREKISTAIKLLVNYSFQTTLGELKEKIERLNEYKVDDPEGAREVKNILHEISGQIRGNSRLYRHIPELTHKIESIAQAKNLRETHKRSIVSELREKLRNIQVNSMGHAGEGDE